ncbi:MAG TPA: ABC transporter ATP-binding protein [Pseudacidobacterium sp.]|jgi:ATP-binding cassette subfamily B protein|nr:ABC transporter ATP-binding protein [Pseudacidobacterium sp.]
MNSESQAGAKSRTGTHRSQNHNSAWADRLSALKNIPPVLHFVWESGPSVVSSNIAIRILVAFLPVGIGIIGRFIIDGVNQIRLHQPLPQYFWWLVAGEMALAIITGVLSRAVDYFDNLLADRYTHHVSVEVMRKAAALDVTAYEDPVFYDRLERARVQATDRLAMIQQMGRLIQQTVAALAFSAVLVRYSPLLLLLLIAGIIPAFLGESHFAFLSYAKNFRQTPVRRQMDYLRQVGGSKEAAKELKLFRLSDYLTNRFTALSHGIYEENVNLNRRRLFWGGLLSILGQCGYYAAYAYCIYRTIQGYYSIGDLTLITTAIMQAMGNIQQAFSTASGVADQALFLTDLIAFFGMKPLVQSKRNALPAPRPVTRGFEFRNVSFSYPGSSRPILRRFNFTLTPGERVALIGENGEGKTTVVKLITRLYDPTEGQILLDGIDLREYDLASLHAEIGVIFQDFMRYEMTARENIAIGRIEVPHKFDDIDFAARKSLASDVIAKLPRSYEQMLGRRFEGGVDLSGGEWQKLALARAYLRDAQLLILDEPTAALDARSEFEVFERFADLTFGKMALLISHRFSTVRMADRIVVLEGGQIVEEGNHAQLMELSGRYAAMFEMQAASYR